MHFRRILFGVVASMVAIGGLATQNLLLGAIALFLFGLVAVDKPLPDSGDKYFKIKIPAGYRIYFKGVSVAGIKHYPDGIIRMQRLKEPNIILKRNPDNPHDSNAIEVLLTDNRRSWQLGHLPRDIAAEIAQKGNPELLARVLNLWIGDRGGMKLTIDILGPKQQFKDYFPEPQ